MCLDEKDVYYEDRNKEEETKLLNLGIGFKTYGTCGRREKLKSFKKCVSF
jgi:hypothetical protein